MRRVTLGREAKSGLSPRYSRKPRLLSITAMDMITVKRLNVRLLFTIAVSERSGPFATSPS